jgi:hypothetical protein
LKADKVAKPKRTEKRETPWPEGFALNDEMRAFAAEHDWPPPRQDREFEKYHQHALQTGRLLKDWVAGWRSWVLKGIEFNQVRPGASPATPISHAPAIDWATRVEKFKNNGLWPLPWGPQPGSGGCRARTDVLARHGFGQTGSASCSERRPMIAAGIDPFSSMEDALSEATRMFQGRPHVERPGRATTDTSEPEPQNRLKTGPSR